MDGYILSCTLARKHVRNDLCSHAHAYAKGIADMRQNYVLMNLKGAFGFTSPVKQTAL